MQARILILLLLVCSQISYGQKLEMKTLKEKGQFYIYKQSVVNEKRTYSIYNKTAFTSISIQIKEYQSFENSYIEVNGVKYFLSKDEHVNIKNGLINSNLISFDLPIYSFKVFTSSISGTVSFHFINGGKVPKKPKIQTNRIQAECFTEPESISQSVWREGLNSPSFSRSFTKVKHLIIHHSAGSNASTNYTQVVRDIYVYHTESNGWSDIGYNYLIAQDGSIFKGRDPDGGAQDNVRGAHFCGKNSSTMGVCLLGDYTSVPPTNAAIASLMNLLSWKLDRESLNAFETFLHSDNPNLSTISGHRDGCATECPGTQTYAQLSKFKKQLNNQIEACYPDKLLADIAAETFEIFEDETVSFNDNSQGDNITWHWSFEGAIPENSSSQNPSNISYPTFGEYNVELVIRRGSITDTAIIHDMVVVKSDAFDVPAVFPNPVNYNQKLVFQLNKKKITQIEVADVSGNVITQFVPEQNTYNFSINDLNSGIYFIRFYGENGVAKMERVVIKN